MTGIGGTEMNIWEKLVLIIASAMAVGCFILTFALPDQDGNPQPLWTSTAFTIALTLATWRYAVDASGSRRSSEASVEELRLGRLNSERSLDELVLSRMDSLRPALAIRYFDEKDNYQSGVNRSIRTNGRKTYLVNVGSGPACNVRVLSNVRFVEKPSRNGSEPPVKIATHLPDLIEWPDQKLAFGPTIGVFSASRETQVCFIASMEEEDVQGYSIAVDAEAIIFITFQDCYGRTFALTQKDCLQTIHGPLNIDQCMELKASMISSEGKIQFDRP
jgi:hypothetical protein